MIDEELWSYHVNNITNLALDTICTTQCFKSLLDKEVDTSVNESYLWGSFLVAQTNFKIFKLYYLQNQDLVHEEYEYFIEKYELFISEFLSSRSSDHSMFHVYTYYDEMIDAYNDLARLLQLSRIEKEND